MASPQKAPVPYDNDYFVIKVPEIVLRIQKSWVRELVRLITYLSGSLAVQQLVEALFQ